MSDTDVVEGPLPVGIATSTGPVALVGQARILPGKEAEFEELIRSILPKIRQEDGNVHYTVNRSHEDASTYLMYEEWENGASIVKHVQQPFMGEYFGQVSGLMAPGADAPGWSSPL